MHPEEDGVLLEVEGVLLGVEGVADDAPPVLDTQ